MKKSHCLRGHPRTPENIDVSGHCKACCKLFREKPEQLLKRDRYFRNYRTIPENKDKHRTWKRSRKGWTKEHLAEVLLEQEGRCAICREMFIKEPYADHEHTDPPKPRGLLCSRCNLTIGHFEDSSALCEAAASYLRKWGK